MEGQYNMRNPAVKRLMREAQELREPTEQYYAQPLEDNLFEWHFTVRGPADSEFDGGVYHGRIILPPEYPMKPPSIILLTPNGRFELHKKICLSISGHHPESWRPSWSIRTALLAIIGFMPTHGAGAIGSLDYTAEERKVLGKKSQEWTCSVCKTRNVDHLPPVSEASEATRAEIRELASQIDFKGETEASKNGQQQQDATGSAAAAPSTSSGGASSADAATNGSPPPTAVPPPPQLTHRKVAASVPAADSTTTQSGTVPLQGEMAGTTSGGRTSLCIMVILSVGIAALLLRRALLYLDENTLP